jgi:hypothetical protein
VLYRCLLLLTGESAQLLSSMFLFQFQTIEGRLRDDGDREEGRQADAGLELIDLAIDFFYRLLQVLPVVGTVSIMLPMGNSGID